MAGIHVRAEGWDVGVRVVGRIEKCRGQDTDVFDVYVTGGSRGRTTECHLLQVHKNEQEDYVVTGEAPDQIGLIAEVADTLYVATDHFEGPVGMQLAYLYPAIAKGEKVQWLRDSETEVPILRLFEVLFPADHAVWQHIEVSDTR